MSEEPLFETQLRACWPTAAWHPFRLILAVSGGADSVALLRAAHNLAAEPARLFVAHYNHRWRGAAADEDAQFVESLAQRLGLEYTPGWASAAGDPTAGGESRARADRYDFLRGAARRFNARYVVTAHTADDQAETILHHMLRGTGLAGLAAMPRVRPLGDGLALVRPMLGLSRADVLNYLAAMGQPFRDDATNADLRFTRNRIRHELLPLLKRDYSATVVESLLRLSSLAADAQRVVGQQVDELAGRCVLDRDPLRVTLRTGELAKPDPYLVRELFVRLWREQRWPMQGMNQAHWSILAELAQTNDAPRGSSLSATLPGAIRAERRSDRMVLIAPQASAACQA